MEKIMKEGDKIIFRKTMTGSATTEGVLIQNLNMENFEGKKLWWTVEHGKKVKKITTISESQIEGLIE